ncbi:DUF559 domain-containing protein [Aquihabitans sp. G128]|uniref:DUF559 domain-containing protein n=1 Tax=Aquihabitans sp. G128 TaxID=2849779 RepID=UPI001C23BA1F|nr:DUF559 domain-containing protein [Aquihabitans sp. G128]QXC63137.1 DUF559 domain-containing protein [Aquihabitans sp. G128]
MRLAVAACFDARRRRNGTQESAAAEDPPVRHTVELLLVAGSQAGTVHRRQLAEAGLADRVIARQVTAGLLTVEHPDVFRLAGAPRTWQQELWLALLSARSASVVSHRSAARLHHVGRFATEHIDLVEVEHHSNRVRGAAAHRSLLLPPHHRTEVDGIPVTTVERTVFDLAGQVSIKRWRRGLPSLRQHQVARALDDAIAGGVEPRRFTAVLDELGGRGRGGTRVMRELMEQRGEGYAATESELEDLLNEVLDRFGLPLPVRQRNLGGLEDRVGRVDFVFTEERVVIEADGRKNHTALLDREGDAWRDLELAAAGFRVIRVTWGQLTTDPRRFVAALRAVLAA